MSIKKQIKQAINLTNGKISITKSRGWVNVTIITDPETLEKFNSQNKDQFGCYNHELSQKITKIISENIEVSAFYSDDICDYTTPKISVYYENIFTY